MFFLSTVYTFCIISFTDGVNLGTYCENFRFYCENLRIYCDNLLTRFCTNDEINSKVWKRSFRLFNPISIHLLNFVANHQKLQITRFLLNIHASCGGIVCFDKS